MKKKLILFILLLSPFSMTYSAETSKSESCVEGCDKQLERDEDTLEKSKDGWWDGVMGELKYSNTKILERRLQILTKYTKCLSKCPKKKND